MSTDIAGLQITVFHPDTLDETMPSLADSIAISTSRGAFSGDTSWSTQGKAIFSTWLWFHIAAVDSAGASHLWNSEVQFSMAYPTPTALSFSHTNAVEFKHWPDTETAVAPFRWFDKAKVFAKHFGTMIDNGDPNLESLYSTDAGSGNMTTDSATSGPDSGYKYFSSAIRIADGLVETSTVIDGDASSRWVQDQDGVWEHGGTNGDTLVTGINGLPICTGSPALWAAFGAKVRAHEGVTSGQTSHQSIWVSRAAASGSDMAKKLQHYYFPNQMDGKLARNVLSQVVRYTWHDLDSAAHQQLEMKDNADSIAKLLGCYFDNDRSH